MPWLLISAFTTIRPVANSNAFIASASPPLAARYVLVWRCTKADVSKLRDHETAKVKAAKGRT